jgi:hypothetical protein
MSHDGISPYPRGRQAGSSGLPDSVQSLSSFLQGGALFLNRRNVMGSGPSGYPSLIESVWQEVLRGLVLGIWPYALTPLSFVLEQHPQYSLGGTAGICYYVFSH